MTHEEFEQKYRLINQITEGSIRTHNALASSGAVVMAHFLDGQAGPARDAVLAHLDALDAERQSRVLERLEIDGAPVLVTKFILDFESLQHWLGMEAPPAEATPAEAAAPPPVQVAPAEPAPAEPESAPGEFTRMFAVPIRVELPTGPAPAVEDAAAPRREEPPAAPADEPGEFTRLFRAATPPPAPADFHLPEPGVELRPAPPSLPELNLYTPAPAQPASAPTPPAAQPAPPPEAPGEFTRIFGRASVPAELPLPPVQPAAAPATMPPLAPPMPPPAAHSIPHSAPPAGGAGEYTRIIAAQASMPPLEPQPVPAAPPSAPLSQEPSPSAKWPLVLGLALVLLLALAFVAYLVLHPL